MGEMCKCENVKMCKCENANDQLGIGNWNWQHFHFVNQPHSDEAMVLLNNMIDGKRLKDISDLPLDLAC